MESIYQEDKPRDGTLNSPVVVLLILMGVVLICLSIKFHFDSYDSKYIPVKAVITDINCERFIINRGRDEYHCTVQVQYEVDGKVLNTNIQTDTNSRYYIGSEIILYVDKYNPVDFDTSYISKEAVSLLASVCGVLLILTTLGCITLKV